MASMSDLASALGIRVVEVPGLRCSRWVSDCHVLLVSDDADDASRSAAIAWALDRLAAPAPK